MANRPNCCDLEGYTVRVYSMKFRTKTASSDRASLTKQFYFENLYTRMYRCILLPQQLAFILNTCAKFCAFSFRILQSTLDTSDRHGQSRGVAYVESWLLYYAEFHTYTPRTMNSNTSIAVLVIKIYSILFYIL